MADVAIETSTIDDMQRTLIHGGSIFTTSAIGYAFSVKSTGLFIYKSTDGGESWDGGTQFIAATVEWASVWFDKHTQGDSGTIIHSAIIDSGGDDVLYRTFDTSDDSLGTLRTVFDGASSGAGSFTEGFISVCKAVGGNIYIQFWLDKIGERGFYRSTDSGVNWTSRTDGADGDAVDQVILLPDGNAADNQDMAMVYWDVSASALSIKKYANSGNSWGETAIASGFTAPSQILQVDAMVRHSDDAIIVIAHEAQDSAGSDFKCFEVTLATPTVTAKADLITATDDVINAGLFVDQTNDDLYGVYSGQDDGAQAVFSLVAVHSKKSTDGGTSWGTETTYSVNTADDNRAIYSGRSTPGNAAGRFIPSFFNDDLDDVFVNFTNSVEITALSAALTGTALPTATEAEIAAGGETVIITLTGDTWLDAGGAFDGQRQAIIDGFDAATTPTNGWNNEVRDKAPTSVAVRTNATTVTMTWTSAASAYDISSAETITVTIPASALTTSSDPVVADETFDVTVVTVGLSIPIAMHYYQQRRR